MLVTRRALSKKTWAGVWTNSFCGHPGPGEDTVDALTRRAREELGITVRDVEPLLPDFRYTATDASGVVEHEICPVFRAVTDDQPSPSDHEIEEWAWVDPESFREAVTSTPFAFSPWVGWQLAEVAAQDIRYAPST